MLPREKMFSSYLFNPDSQVQDRNANLYLIIDRIKKLKTEIKNGYLDERAYNLLRPEIIESWLQSKKNGLDHLNRVRRLDKSVFHKLLADKGYIIKAAQPFVYSLGKTLSSSEYLFFITDEYGVILFVWPCNTKMAVKAKELKAQPGMICSEETVGTCAHVLCLKLKEPIQTIGAEHYLDFLGDQTCYSAPLFDWQKNLLGSINVITSLGQAQSSYILNLVIALAMGIDNQINSDKLLHSAIEAAEGGCLIINNKGVITETNAQVKRMLEYGENNIVGFHYEDLLGSQPLIESVMHSGKQIFNSEMKVSKLNKSLHLSSARPVGYCYSDNKSLGCVLSIRSTAEIRNLHRENSDVYDFQKIIGSSLPMRKSIELARKFSTNVANVLLLGESGSGKEVFAQAVHQNSRPGKPFIAINCASIPQSLIESELFGYDSGAFTGAERRGRSGKIELANEGTLFLDEIGDMPVELQPVLLRVLEDKKVMRLGSSRTISVDFRLIAATNKDLKELVSLNRFREDLYYRLSVFKVSIPPLRERGRDIILLANYFIQKYARINNTYVPMLSDVTKLKLMNYHWPGNVRQLENAMLYAVTVCNNDVITPDDLPDDILEPELSANITTKTEGSRNPLNNKLSFKEMEKIVIMEAMEKCDNQVRKAAEILGLSKSTLYRKLQAYNLMSNEDA